MSTRTEVTEDQIQAGFKALLGSERDRVSLSMVRAILTGALNPPLVLCKNCGKIEAQHHRLNMFGRHRNETIIEGPVESGQRENACAI